MQLPQIQPSTFCKGLISSPFLIPDEILTPYRIQGCYFFVNFCISILLLPTFQNFIQIQIPLQLPFKVGKRPLIHITLHRLLGAINLFLQV